LMYGMNLLLPPMRVYVTPWALQKLLAASAQQAVHDEKHCSRRPDGLEKGAGAEHCMTLSAI